MGKKSRSLGRFILRHKYIFTMLGFLLIIGFLDTNNLLSRYRLRMHNEELRKEIAEYDRQYARDSRQLHEIQNSPSAVEEVARKLLFMKTASEDVYVVENNDSIS